MLETKNPNELAERQLEAIKNRAIELWGEDKWLAKLVQEFSKVTNADSQKGRYTMVQRFFQNKTCSIANLNALLVATNCRFQMVCYAEPVVKLL